MVYTINANAKNVWIRDNEDTRDLSIQTDASSVYLDNGRTLEQELGEGSMVSNVATIDSAMSKIIDGTLDGAYESCVFKGKSLVNLGKEVGSQYHNIGGEGTQITSDGYFKIPHAGSENSHSVRLKFGLLEPLIKPDTVYSLIVEIAENTTQNARIGFTGHNNLSCVEPVDKNTNIASAVGTHVKLIKRRSEVTARQSDLYFCIWDKTNVDTTKHIKFRYMILEGDWTNKELPPFFTGLCDVKMPILRNVGKNLFDGNFVYSTYVSGHPVIYDNNRPVTFPYTTSPSNRGVGFVVEVKPNTQYTMSIDNNIENGVFVGAGYSSITDIGMQSRALFYIGNVSNTDVSVRTFTTTNECHYVVIGNYINYNYEVTGGSITFNEPPRIQLEESSALTVYEPYKTNILHTPETVTLRSLPNGVRDELNLKTGEYIKRIGEIVLNGTQDMSSDSNGVFIQANDVKRFLNYTGKMACDKLPIMPTYGHLADVENGVSGYTNANGYLGQNWLYIRINNSINKDEVKEWLTQNPTTVQYELAEPVVTKVALTQSEPIVKIGTELPNGVCDTYNLLTGEYIQRVGKVVLDGSEAWTKVAFPSTNTTHCYSSLKIENLKMPNVNEKNIVSDRFQTVPQESYNYSNEEMYTWRTGELLYVNILRSRLATSDVQGLKAWFKENPTTVWYELKNPIVTKKNGLPNTYGITLPNGITDKYDESTRVYTQNIGKIVLNGDETISLTDSSKENTIAFIIEDYKLNQVATGSDFLLCDRFQSIDHLGTLDVEGITYTNNALGRLLYIRINKSKLSEQNVNGFKKWLSDNVTTVYHQLAEPKTIDIPLINVGQVLPNGVCDTYNPITKEYVKRVSQGVLDGTEENWILANNALTNTVRFATLNTPPFPDAKVLGSIISNLHFGNELSYENDKELIEINSGKDVVIRISRARLSSPDLDGFKKWIKKNPLTVWYELENPTTSTVDLDLSTLYSSSPIAYENGHIILESGHNGQSLLPTLEYSTVTNRVKQIESIGEQVLRQEKQLTMLEQMLIQNIIGLDYNNTVLALNLKINEVM